MASENNSDIDWPGRECRRLEINANIGRPDEFPLNILNAKRLRTRAIPF